MEGFVVERVLFFPCLFMYAGTVKWVAVPQEGMLPGTVMWCCAAQLDSWAMLLSRPACWVACASPWIWLRTRGSDVTHILLIWHRVWLWHGASSKRNPKDIFLYRHKDDRSPDRLFTGKIQFGWFSSKPVCVFIYWKCVRHHMSVICLWYVGVCIIFFNSWMACV